MPRRPGLRPPLAYRSEFTFDEIQRFMSFHEIDPVSNCWLFKGRLDSNGYAQIWMHGQARSGARVAMAMFRDGINEGEEPDHFIQGCPHHCNNPWHLRKKTSLDNSTDGGYRRQAKRRAMAGAGANGNGHDDIPF